ncbi:MAG TPA: hypothetical protein VFC99_19820 [Acidimicrobiia bacterium]|nr:hypothetical protein [Acidimicrobiia bacterium]
MVVLACVLIWLILVGVGFLVGTSKGRPVAGLVLGLLLGPIGVGLVATGPSRSATRAGWRHPSRAQVMCPWCLERIPVVAKRCDHCLRPVTPPPATRLTRT